MSLLIEPIESLRKGTIAKIERARARLEWRTKNPRTLDMVARYKAGEILESIGREHGVTRERVRQILKAAGINSWSGGYRVQTLLKVGEKKARAARRYDERERIHFKRYGMSREAIDSLSPYVRSHPDHPLAVFLRFRQNAKRYGLRADLTFAQWWSVWRDSGKWDERGRGFGYCLCRWDTNQAFTLSNVRVVRGDERSRDSYILKPAAMRAAKSKMTRESRGL